MKSPEFPLHLKARKRLGPDLIAPNNTITFKVPVVILEANNETSVGDSANLNLLRDVSGSPDYLLRISFRRAVRRIFFNSRTAEGNWGPEEFCSMEGLFRPNHPAEIVVHETEKKYDITINGALIYSYNKRIFSSTSGLLYSKSDNVFLPMFGEIIGVQLGTDDDDASNVPRTYEQAYFPLTAAQVAQESEVNPFDVVIIGSGIGGGVLAASLLQKNHKLSSSAFTPWSTCPDQEKEPIRKGPPTGEEGSEPPQPLRILVIERGGLTFITHSLNGPRPSVKGTTSQANDLFFRTFRDQFDLDDETAQSGIWVGGPVFCLGGRSTVWGLFAPRVALPTLNKEFPSAVTDALMGDYYLKAEDLMKVEYPKTLPIHQALIDRLNLRANTDLPATQWKWGGVASEFSDPKNFDFAEGAYSTVDVPLEAAMDSTTVANDPNFQTLLNAEVLRLDPPPPAQSGSSVELGTVKSVIVKDGDGEHMILCNQVVLSAGSVESAAVLLRSVDGDPNKYGTGFKDKFGHITDHRIMSVAMPFFYQNMTMLDQVGGVKLETDIQFDIKKGRPPTTVDDSVALANISLNASSYLPRGDVSDGNLPIFNITYIVPSELALTNSVTLNSSGEPIIHVEWAEDEYLEDKRVVLKEFAVDAMNKIVDVLGIRFAKKNDNGYTPFLSEITVSDVELKEAGAGIVAHELGTIPMDTNVTDGIVDTDLSMKYGWNNVSVCDLSVFPYSPAANPTLTLAALALRLSDKILPDQKYEPITVFNLTGKDVLVSITESRSQSDPSFGPDTPITIASGGSNTWKIAQREAMTIASCACADSYDIQMVFPGVNAMIVKDPPAASTAACTCKKKAKRSS